MTGRRPSSTGIYANDVVWHEAFPGITSLPRHFKANGYHVVGGGKIYHHMPGFNRHSDWHDYFDQVFDSHYHDRLVRGLNVKDFQWPSQIGFGLAYRPDNKWLVAMDLKQIGWASVMEDFRMTFKADANQANPMAAGFAGTSMDLTLKQAWDDQLVIGLGAAYQYNEDLTFRFGMNHASNPVPDSYLNPLFPAIVENHYTLGAGYKVRENQTVNASMQIVSENECSGNDGCVNTHSQLNFQLMYTIGF